MRIISFYYTHKPGGFCKRLYRLLNALAARGHAVRYFTLDQPPSNALTGTVDVERIPFCFSARSGFLFWSAFSLWAPIFIALRTLKARPDRIAIFGAYYSFLALPARIVSGAPVTLFIRSLVFSINRITEKPALLSALSDIFEFVGMRTADRLVAMSESMATELRRFMKLQRSIEILPNDVPQRGDNLTPENEDCKMVWEQLDNGKKMVLISGVFDQRKNVALALNAFELLTRETPSHQLLLVIAGKGAELDSAYAQLSSETQSRVIRLGWIDSISALYPRTFLGIHPALHEGMPNSVLEAWSYDIPVLVSATPELQEMAPARELWIEVGDVAALSQTLRQADQDADFYATLKSKSIACAARLKFDWDQRAVDLVLLEAIGKA